MPISRLEILGYRGFSELGVLDFAVPNGKSGSGLTILTGPNNAGKSSILECLRARSGHSTPSFTEGVRNRDTGHVEINYTINDATETIKSASAGSSETTRSEMSLDFEVFVLPSRRAFFAYFARGTIERSSYIANTGLPPQRTPSLTLFEQRLFNIQANPKKINKILESVLNYKIEWTIDQNDQGYHFLKILNDGHAHSSDGAGEGILSLFSIVDSLHDSSPGNAVVIDEPELSLHPSLQKRLLLLIKKFSEDRQIIISTHSPYFVDFESVCNGGHIARVAKLKNKTKIHQLSETGKASIAKISNRNINNPHLLGLDAREIFFLDERIILTEGQEDVVLYPFVLNQIETSVSGNFFGWGAGGANNFPYMCSILHDLGFTKVAGILDADKLEVRERLSIDYPEYYFCCIPADDVRTKRGRKPTDPVHGLLNEDLTIRNEYINETKNIFNNLEIYLNSI